MIPSIEQLRQRPAMRALEARFGADATVDALRDGAPPRARGASPAARPSLADADVPSSRGSRHVAAARLGDAFRPSLAAGHQRDRRHRPHESRPRAARRRRRSIASPRSPAATRRSSTTSARGARGRRDVHAEALLCRLTGAEAAVVVNNNAAATLLVLAALAAGREVIVSRGELVEIGGGFRVPDVMAQSGAMLREVGTTNKTRAADYAAAISDRTALILRVHPSNFRIEGFTERPTLAELVALGRRFGVPVVEDLGSGYLAVPARAPRRRRPSRGSSRAVRSRPRSTAGVDVCCFSGDKLLGGPQAGIIVGRAALVERVRTPSADARAARRQADLRRARGDAGGVRRRPRGRRPFPVQRMLTMTAEQIRARAEPLAARLEHDARVARRAAPKASRRSAAAAHRASSCRPGSSPSRKRI